MSYILPLGPYHPALKEPVYIKLSVEGDIIKESEIFLGYNHRGIEKLAESMNYIQTITLVERICGVCSYSHTLAYCLTLEEINDIKVPKRGSYIRVIISELERIQSHFLGLALISKTISFDSLFMKCFAIRENIIDILEMISGNRINYSMNIIGGVRRDINNEQIEKILEIINKMKDEFKSIFYIFQNDFSFKSRTKGIGILSKEYALKFGICGPCGRASGVEYDIRKTNPYCNYEDFDFKIPVLTDGDVFSRATIMLLEIEESINIINQAVSNIPEGDINLGFKIPRIKKSEAMVVVEAPKGELSYYVVSNGSDKNQRVSIHAPIFKNAAIIPNILKNNTIEDVSLIVLSTDPCFSCLDK